MEEKLLTPQQAKDYYDRLLSIHKEIHDMKPLKMIKSVSLWEGLLKLVTKDKMPDGDTLHDRIMFTSGHHELEKDLYRKSHSVRQVCNKIRHENLEPGLYDYQTTFETVARWVHTYSGTDIPGELKNIYKNKTRNTQTKNSRKIQKEEDLDFKINKTPKFLILLLVDTGGTDESGQEKLRLLSLAVKTFFHALFQKDQAFLSTEIGLIASSSAGHNIILDVESIQNIYEKILYLQLAPEGSSAIGEGFSACLDLIRKRREKYASSDLEYYKPWILVFTENRTMDAVLEKHPSFSAEDHNTFILHMGERTNSRLKENTLSLSADNYFKFFIWLEQCISKIINVHPGEQCELPSVKTWNTKNK